MNRKFRLIAFKWQIKGTEYIILASFSCSCFAITANLYIYYTFDVNELSPPHMREKQIHKQLSTYKHKLFIVSFQAT